jgi:glycosyltransferase involved in cell wall biosynthesis
MQVTVVIPAYNARGSLRACLLSLNHQTAGEADGFDVVVVDDGSTDGTGAMIEELDLRYELVYHYAPRSPLSGRAAARNLGIERARGELVVMIDADQVIPPGFLGEHIRFHAYCSDLVVIGPRVFLAPGEIDVERLSDGFSFDALPQVGQRDSREWIWARLSENLNNLATCWHYLFTCNASVRRRHLIDAGGFDEAFRGWGLEDSELGYRLRSRGLAFGYNPRAFAIHAHREPLTAARQRELYSEWRRNLTYFTDKHTGLEVAAQWILDRCFDPDKADLQWAEGCVRFEYAVRAMRGRLPSPPACELVEVDHANLAAVRARLTEPDVPGNLLILDTTGDVELPILVQTLNTQHELAYFRCRGPKLRKQLLAAYGLSSC